MRRLAFLMLRLYFFLTFALGEAIRVISGFGTSDPADHSMDLVRNEGSTSCRMRQGQQS
jgi:hypothetical protein